MSDTKLQKPLISIITVNYNEKNIERTLKSIVTQTFQDFEWIIIDGGSNPETLSIINKYKNRINILISEKDDGVYDAMNKGIKISGGSWLIFMNAGDSFYENTSLEKIFSKYITAIQQKDIIYCDSIYHTIDNIKYKPVFPDKLDSKFWYESCISHQSSFIKRELFEKYGINPSVPIRTRNTVTCVKLCQKGMGLCFIPENYMKNIELQEPPLCFSVGDEGAFSTLTIAFRKGAYLPAYARDFIRMAQQNL